MSRVRLLNITKRFGSAVAVNGVDLDVAEGEFVTLLGPSGCGKTTTLRMIAGLIEPSTGQILFDEQEVTYLPPNHRNIGFAFQTPALFPHLSVANNVAFGLAVKKQDKQTIERRVGEMLALVELDGFGGQMPSQLSGEQQQRVALARMLATDPGVLLFDEPLSALDHNLRETLKYAILDLQRKTRKTAIYVTHDQSEAFAISDRIVVMNQGKIEQIGTQTSIYLEPQTRFVAEFIGANNVIEGKVVAFEMIEGETYAIISSGKLTLRSPARIPLALRDPVLAYIRPENIQVLTGEQEMPHAINVLEGDVVRVIFEGATAQLRVDVDGVELRADVTGNQRITLNQGRSQVWLSFNEVTLLSLAPSPIAM